MSALMGKRTDTSAVSRMGSGAYESSGLPVPQVCPACLGRHNGKSRPKCSRRKQQMRLEGKL